MTSRSLEEPSDWWFAEEGLRFTCTGCGKCCTGTSGSVSLSRDDLHRLAAFFKQPVGAVVRRYTRMTRGRRVLLNKVNSSDCIFLTGQICQVYDARPTQCRTYPWWLSTIRDRESWEEAAQHCEGINHPDASFVPVSEILQRCEEDIENDANLQHPWP